MRFMMALVALVVVAGAAAQAAPAKAFKHIVIVFQENRTPDNIFGSNPTFERGVDIASSGLDSKGKTIPLTATPMAGCYDPAHSHHSFEVALTQGWDQVTVADPAGCTLPANPLYKFVDNSTGEVQPYFDIATNYSFANHMYQTNQGPSFEAHQFIFGGTSAPVADTPLFTADNMIMESEDAGCVAPPDQSVKLIDGSGNEASNPPIYPCLEHNTLADVLDAAKISWRYYSPTPGGIWVAPNAINHICVPQMMSGALSCTGPDWTNGSVAAMNNNQVLTDITSCNLAAVSWVIPTGAASDHANTTDGSGPDWVASVVNQVGQNPTCASGESYWKDTAIIITWDDWGGWFDHEQPPKVKLQPTSPPAWGDGYTYGFRVPMMIVSAYTRPGYVDNDVHDFGSILYFIEKNFNLGFIGPGTDMYTNYADAQEAFRQDDLHKFFSRTTPRAFTPIETRLKASYFLGLPPSHTPVDND